MAREEDVGGGSLGSVGTKSHSFQWSLVEPPRLLLVEQIFDIKMSGGFCTCVPDTGQDILQTTGVDRYAQRCASCCLMARMDDACRRPWRASPSIKGTGDHLPNGTCVPIHPPLEGLVTWTSPISFMDWRFL